MKKNSVLFITIFTFIVVLVWVSLSIYHARVSSTIPEAINIQIRQIIPTFDQSVIDRLRTRKKTNPRYQFFDTSKNVPSVTPSPPPPSTLQQSTDSASQQTLSIPSPSIPGGTL